MMSDYFDVNAKQFLFSWYRKPYEFDYTIVFFPIIRNASQINISTLQQYL